MRLMQTGVLLVSLCAAAAAFDDGRCADMEGAVLRTCSAFGEGHLCRASRAQLAMQCSGSTSVDADQKAGHANIKHSDALKKHHSSTGNGRLGEGADAAPTGAFDAAVTDKLKQAEAMHDEMLRRGGIEGIPDGAALLRKWKKSADGRFVTRTKKGRAAALQKLKRKVAKAEKKAAKTKKKAPKTPQNKKKKKKKQKQQQKKASQKKKKTRAVPRNSPSGRPKNASAAKRKKAPKMKQTKAVKEDCRCTVFRGAVFRGSVMLAKANPKLGKCGTQCLRKRATQGQPEKKAKFFGKFERSQKSKVREVQQQERKTKQESKEVFKKKFSIKQLPPGLAALAKGRSRHRRGGGHRGRGRRGGRRGRGRRARGRRGSIGLPGLSALHKSMAGAKKGVKRTIARGRRGRGRRARGRRGSIGLPGLSALHKGRSGAKKGVKRTIARGRRGRGRRGRGRRGSIALPGLHKGRAGAKKGAGTMLGSTLQVRNKCQAKYGKCTKSRRARNSCVESFKHCMLAARRSKKSISDQQNCQRWNRYCLEGKKKDRWCRKWFKHCKTGVDNSGFSGYQCFAMRPVLRQDCGQPCELTLPSCSTCRRLPPVVDLYGGFFGISKSSTERIDGKSEDVFTPQLDAQRLRWPIDAESGCVACPVDPKHGMKTYPTRFFDDIPGKYGGKKGVITHVGCTDASGGVAQQRKRRTGSSHKGAESGSRTSRYLTRRIQMEAAMALGIHQPLAYMVCTPGTTSGLVGGTHAGTVSCFSIGNVYLPLPVGPKQGAVVLWTIRCMMWKHVTCGTVLRKGKLVRRSCTNSKKIQFRVADTCTEKCKRRWSGNNPGGHCSLRVAIRHGLYTSDRYKVAERLPVSGAFCLAKPTAANVASLWGDLALPLFEEDTHLIKRYKLRPDFCQACNSEAQSYYGQCLNEAPCVGKGAPACFQKAVSRCFAATTKHWTKMKSQAIAIRKKCLSPYNNNGTAAPLCRPSSLVGLAAHAKMPNVACSTTGTAVVHGNKNHVHAPATLAKCIESIPGPLKAWRFSVRMKHQTVFKHLEHQTVFAPEACERSQTQGVEWAGTAEHAKACSRRATWNELSYRQFSTGRGFISAYSDWGGLTAKGYNKSQPDWRESGPQGGRDWYRRSVWNGVGQPNFPLERGSEFHFNAPLQVVTEQKKLPYSLKQYAKQYGICSFVGMNK